MNWSQLLFASVFYIHSHFGLQRIAPEPIRITGKTMGTTYHITYFDKQKRNFKSRIDHLLLEVNHSISTYDPSSDVSIFNHSRRGVSRGLPYLMVPLTKASEVYKASAGAFDLTVMPLVNDLDQASS